MELSEVPDSELLVASADPEAWFNVLNSILVRAGRSRFEAMTVIRGASKTGRVLMVHERWDAVKLPRGIFPWGLTAEMMRLVQRAEVRYDPPENLGMVVQGWEVRRATVDNEPIVIIWASWVPRSE